jgi:hypothetical protein
MNKIISQNLTIADLGWAGKNTKNSYVAKIIVSRYILFILRFAQNK